MQMYELLNSLSTARSEQQQFTNSVYGKFVIPHSIQVYDLRKQPHSIALLGSRGCGKTTYVRYFSHWTQFDKNRIDFSKADFESIILYWKPDTVFYTTIAKGWAPPQQAEHFFFVLSGLEVLQEIISSLINISYHFDDVLSDLTSSDDFKQAIHAITGTEFRSLDKVNTWINDELFKTRTSVRHLDTDNLVKIDAGSVVKRLIPAIQKSCTRLTSARFSIYVDEFENLSQSQQKIINGYRKGSDATFTWNVAYKQFAEVSNQTDGPEILSSPDDYREMFMEIIYGAERHPKAPLGNYINTPKLKLLTSEIFLLGLLKNNLSTDIELLSIDVLGDPNKVSLRAEAEYKTEIFQLMEKIFPTHTNADLAVEAMKLNAVSNIVTERLRSLEKLTSDQVESFISSKPGEALVAAAISYQKTFSPQQLIDYIENNQPGKKAFVERIQTFRLTALLHLNTYDYINIPIYSGFERFNHICVNNIRHFIELCYQTLKQLDISSDIKKIEDIPSSSLMDMHKGVTDASSLFMERIKSFEPMGNRLSVLTHRMGTLFQTLQRHKVQSEPERVSFILKGQRGELSENLDKVITAAKGWNLLLENQITRDRKSNKVVSANKQYRLNPIYSPFFGISYLTGRTVELSQKDFYSICNDSDEDFDIWIQKFSEKLLKKEQSNNNIQQIGLFD